MLTEAILKETKIYLEGNQLMCDDCSLMYVLQLISNMNPQQINCSDNKSFDFKHAYFQCTIVPDLLKVMVVCFIAPLPVFAVLKHFQRKKLRRKYDHKSFANEDLDIFIRESKIRKEIKHERIRKLKSCNLYL